MDLSDYSWADYLFIIYFVIEIQSMQGWTAATRHGIIYKKKKHNRLKHTENLFRKNLHLIGVC